MPKRKPPKIRLSQAVRRASPTKPENKSVTFGRNVILVIDPSQDEFIRYAKNYHAEKYSPPLASDFKCQNSWAVSGNDYMIYLAHETDLFGRVFDDVFFLSGWYLNPITRNDRWLQTAKWIIQRLRNARPKRVKEVRDMLGLDYLEQA